MVTQKFMGRNQIVKRLAAQVGDKGLAYGLLKKRKLIDTDGKLTSKGQERNYMTAKERAVDRASKSSGHSAKEYKYSPRTNRATLKRKK